MHQLQSHIAAAMTVVSLVISSLNALPRDDGSSQIDPTRPNAVEERIWPMTMVTGDGTVLINAVNFDLSLPQVKAIIRDFPSESHPVFTETGRQLDQYDYHRAAYQFAGDTLVRIGVPYTPRGIRVGGSIDDAQRIYGRAVHAYRSSNGRFYAAFVASERHNTAWIVDFDNKTGVIGGIWLANNLDVMRSDAGAARS